MNLYKTISNRSINPYFHWRKYHTDRECKIYLKVFRKFFWRFYHREESLLWAQYVTPWPNSLGTHWTRQEKLLVHGLYGLHWCCLICQLFSAPGLLSPHPSPNQGVSGPGSIPQRPQSCPNHALRQQAAPCLHPQPLPGPSAAAARCLPNALGFVKNEAFLICLRWQTSSCHILNWCIHSFPQVTNNRTKIPANSTLSLLPRIVWAQLIPSAPLGSRYRLIQFWNAQGPQPCKAWSNPDWSPWKGLHWRKHTGSSPTTPAPRNQPWVGVASRLHPTAPAWERDRLCPRTAAGHGPASCARAALHRAGAPCSSMFTSHPPFLWDLLQHSSKKPFTVLGTGAVLAGDGIHAGTVP